MFLYLTINERQIHLQQLNTFEFGGVDSKKLLDKQ